MAYLSLYRKYRPTKLSQLVRQEHIVKILKSQIINDRVGHAYLFCGPRGTGKTSTAKIFAKAVNCLNNREGEPCDICKSCIALNDSANLDVLEIDAASNNRVDEIRELRERVQYPPAIAGKKVYIIDEVHMLTDQAFNALLKTLEEPPSHAIFILATTEVQKLPATILSRCMRFDFKLIPLIDIANHIKEIFNDNNKEYQEEAITEIARYGAGSVRDALSIAEVCLSYSNGKLLYKDVMEILGGTDFDNIIELVYNIINSKTGVAISSVNALSENGKSISVLCKDIISFLRNIIVAKTCDNAEELLSLPKEYLEKIISKFKTASTISLIRSLEIFCEVENTLKFVSNAKIALESAVIKASFPEKDYNIDMLFNRVTSIEKTLSENQFKNPEKAEINRELAPQKLTKNIAESLENINIISETEESNNYIQEESVKKIEKVDKARVFGLIINALRKRGEVILYTIFSENTCDFDDDTLIIKVQTLSAKNAIMTQQNSDKIKEVLKELGYQNFKVEVVDGLDGGEYESSVKELKEKFKNINIIEK